MTTVIPIGVRPDGRRENLKLETLLKHAVVTGTTGSGKSGFVLSLLLSLLRSRVPINIVVIDAKGETVETLRTFLAAIDGGRLVDSRGVAAVEPFGPNLVPLNLLHPVDGLASEVQANLTCLLVASLVDGGLGPRMTTILAFFARAAMALKGSLLDVVRMLEDDAYREAVGHQIADEEVRRYVLETYPLEPRPSRESLRARLEWLLLLPFVRKMFCAPTCVSGADLIGGRLTTIDLGGAPQGFLALATFMGAFLLQLISAAVFARKIDADAPPLLVVCDEWQTLAQAVPSEFERLLAQSRFKRTGVWFLNQTLTQIEQAGGGLLASLKTNVCWQAAFRPKEKEIADVLPLLPLTGAMVDPEAPDQLMSRAAERAHLVQRLSCLPPRHALFADFIRGRADVIRTLDLPFSEARRRAEAAPTIVDALRRGRYGVSADALIPTLALTDEHQHGGAGLSKGPLLAARPPLVLASENDADVPAHPGVTRSGQPRRARRPQLVLP